MKTARRILLALAKQYASIGGQAVIEGVMMRSPNAFVVAIRKPDGAVRLRKDQWFGVQKKSPIFKRPIFRGVVTLFEAMANGLVSLNYSANVAMKEELKKEALSAGKDLEELKSDMGKSEALDWATFAAMGFSLMCGVALFVFAPHATTAGLNNWLDLGLDLDGIGFHLLDGLIKACIFVSYIFAIGFVPDIKRVFQYHGAEHKAISTFEAGEELTVENSRKYSTRHPRCGTSFIFLLLCVSIVFFSAIFSVLPFDENSPELVKHIKAVGLKVLMMFPIAGTAYEVIRFLGSRKKSALTKAMNWPGMMLQDLTTREPDDEQLEVALCSIKAALELEESKNLRDASEKICELEELDIESIEDIAWQRVELKNYLEG